MRNAVRRREEQIEQDEMESGELNLIPYLDMVTNLMLFLLASVAAGIVFTQIDTQLPDKAPPSTSTTQPQTNPDDQPLKMIVSITRDRMVLWSICGLEGTLTQPKASFPRTGRDGESCDGAYMCESGFCGETLRCGAPPAGRKPRSRRRRCSISAACRTRCSRSRIVATPASSASRRPTRSSCRPTARFRTTRSRR